MDHDNQAPTSEPPSEDSSSDDKKVVERRADGKPAGSSGDSSTAKPSVGKTSKGAKPNNVRKLRIDRMMSKAELARSANLSVLTIDRVEKGFGCRIGTKRKILEALGLSLADRVKVFGEEE
jgi:DNA-binding XRE family transcriptional regulator